MHISNWFSCNFLHATCKMSRLICIFNSKSCFLLNWALLFVEYYSMGYCSMMLTFNNFVFWGRGTNVYQWKNKWLSSEYIFHVWHKEAVAYPHFYNYFLNCNLLSSSCVRILSAFQDWVYINTSCIWGFFFGFTCTSSLAQNDPRWIYLVWLFWIILGDKSLWVSF